MPRIRHKVLNQDISYRILDKLENGTRPLDMDDAWEAANIVRVHIPELEGVDDGTAAGSTGKIKLHKLVAYQVVAAFAEIGRKGLKKDILSFAGSYYPRMIRGSQISPSEHSFGTAWDINAAWNGLNKKPAAPGTKGSMHRLYPIFEKYGGYWGGRFERDDGMHDEIHKILSKAEVDKIAGISTKPTIVSTLPTPKPKPVRLRVNGVIVPDAFQQDGKWFVPFRFFSEDIFKKTIIGIESGDQTIVDWKVY
jgi:hypothetical protein